MDSQQPLFEVIQSLQDRMSKFEGALLKSTTPTTLEALSSDYSAFKTFTIGVLKSLQQQMELLARDADRQEMRSRRKILLVHGMPEETKEDTASVVSTMLKDTLNLPDFSKSHISRCHRMGRAMKGGRPRPILVKISDVAMRDKVWFSKTKLKGSDFTLSEFLTKPRHIVFMAARERFGVKSCWTRDGFIHIAAPDGSRHRICCVAELDKISPARSEKPAAQVAEREHSSKTRAPSARRAAGGGGAGASSSAKKS